MIRYDKIKASLFGGVGWRQSTLTGYDIVDSENLQSDSGLLFQDAHPYVTIKNIKDAQENVAITDAEFNSYLKSIQEASIVNACNSITNGKSDFIQSVNLYPYEKSFKNAIDGRGKFVGFIFEQRTTLGMIAKVPWIELSFNEDVTFDIHLFNSNLKDPIQTKSVTASAFESTIVDLNWFIADDVTHKGGNFYIGYFEDDLGTAKALEKDFDLSNFQISTKCYYVRPVSLDADTSVIDVTTLLNESDTFGLNIGVEIYSDYTELIIRNKNLFWNAICFQVAEKVLNTLLVSTRSNRTQRMNSIDANQIMFALYGDDVNGIKGVESKLKMAISDIKKTLFYVPKISRRTLR